MSNASKIRMYARVARCPEFGEEHVRLGTDSDVFFRLMGQRNRGGTQTVTAAPARERRSSAAAAEPSSREAEIRRMARKAGLPKLGERHVREGTSAADFFDILAARLAGGTTGKDTTMTKRSKSERELEKGAAEARSLMGSSFRGFAQPYARAGRDDEKKRPEDDDDSEDDRDEVSDDDTGEEVEDDDGDDTKADAEAAAKRGAQTVRNLMGKGVRSSAARSLANIREHRREAKRADTRRIDEALGAEAGAREARKLLGK